MAIVRSAHSPVKSRTEDMIAGIVRQYQVVFADNGNLIRYVMRVPFYRRGGSEGAGHAGEGGDH